MSNRRKFTSEFKKKVVLEALKERETLSELAQKHDLHPQQITLWKAHFLAHAEAVFEKEDSAKKEQDLDKERDELLRTIGQQKVEIDFLKKKLR
jgi:transposase-like protein